MLGDIPLEPEIVAGGDNGTPIIVSYPSSVAANKYYDIAQKICSKIEW